LRVDLDGTPKRAWTGEGSYQGRTMIIATGSMGRINRFPGEQRLVGRGVSYCATCDAAFFRGQAVAVAGDTDEAVEEALTLTRFASRVHLVVPRSEIRASEGLVEELTAHEGVTIYPATSIKEIKGENQVEAIDIGARGKVETIAVSGVFIYLQGNVPVVDFLGEQVSINEDGCLVVDDTFRTSIDGVFAVGDVLCKHVKQAAIAAAEGVIAATAVDRYLHGRQQLRPDWSS